MQALVSARAYILLQQVVPARFLVCATLGEAACPGCRTCPGMKFEGFAAAGLGSSAASAWLGEGRFPQYSCFRVLLLGFANQ